jgi:hypothetical protein
MKGVFFTLSFTAFPYFLRMLVALQKFIVLFGEFSLEKKG